MAIFIVMGVSGSGKSTVGIALATQLVIPFLDADTYHPAANVASVLLEDPTVTVCAVPLPT